MGGAPMNDIREEEGVHHDGGDANAAPAAFLPLAEKGEMYLLMASTRNPGVLHLAQPRQDRSRKIARTK